MNLLPYLVILIGFLCSMAMLWSGRKQKAAAPRLLPKPQVPRYLRLITLALLITAVVFVALPFVLRFFDPSAGSFGIDTLNALAFGAVLLCAILHLSYLAYKLVFPRFKTYQQESLEGEGKLFENVTDHLEAGLRRVKLYTQPHDMLPVLIENRKVAQFKFLVRCVRLSFCLLAFYALVLLSEHVLTAALTVVPK